MPHPKSEPVSQNGKSAQNKQCRAQSAKQGVSGTWRKKGSAYRHHIHPLCLLQTSTTNTSVQASTLLKISSTEKRKPIQGALPHDPPRFCALVSRRATRCNRKKKAAPNLAPPSRKPSTALRSLLSVALSSVPVKQYQYTMIVRLFR